MLCQKCTFSSHEALINVEPKAGYVPAAYYSVPSSYLADTRCVNG